MVKLNCPLCCSESFPTPSSLKSHLLSVLESLLCPICNEKFDGVAELAEHLDTDCGAPAEAETPSIEAEDYDEVVQSSILAKALTEDTQELKTETEIQDDDTQYYCQSCEVHLNDIDEHLNEFHQGQEIILEGLSDPLEEGSAEEQPPNDEEIPTEEAAPADDEDPVILLMDSESETPPELAASPEQDVEDKDGRVYTRKFVKIDKFWLEQQTKKNPAVESHTDKPTKLIMCRHCNAYFPEPHTCGPKAKKIHSCDICSTVFPTFKSLRLHQRMHEPIKTREVEAPVSYDNREGVQREMFICKVCYKTYDKAYEEVHMHSHDYNNEYNCHVCNKKFFTKSNLEMHMKAHNNRKNFACSYCKKSFISYDSLQEHISNQCQKRLFACQYCGRRFSRPHEKVKHERIHTGEKPHVCDVCGKAFRVSYCLTLHLRTHSGTRPYQCQKCGKRFKAHSVYNHHLLTHSEVRNYKCPFCPKAFKTSVQLAGHKNSHIKPFSCTHCNRPFASLYAVRAHMESHKKENNLKYECYVCGALYSRSFALRDHLKEQHHQEGGEKGKSLGEEIDAANSILVNEENIILGLEEGGNIEIIENEGE